MNFVTVNGALAHYCDEGAKGAPALVFINSLGTDFRIWDEVARALEGEFRLLRYDKRGHGLSQMTPATYEIADFARDLIALMDRLSLARATIVGLSIGGLIAQELYRQKPALVRALVLMDTAVKIGNDELWDGRMRDVERGGVEALGDATMQRWFSKSYRANESDCVAGWRNMLTRTPAQGYLAACGAIKRADLRSYAAAIRVPTLCLVGEEDGATPVALVRETAALIGKARFEVIAGAGHLPNLEKAETIAKLIAEHARAAPT